MRSIRPYLSTLAVAIFLPLGPTYAADLVGYWNFEEGAGSQVLDQSGNGNHGALTGASRGPGKVGQGLVLDGSGGVTIPNSPSLDSLPGGFTLEAWILATAYPLGNSDFGTIYFKTDRENRVHQLHFQVGDNVNVPTTQGRLLAGMNSSAGGIGPRTVGLNEWHFVAWTYDETFHRFYDNGVEVFRAPFTDPWLGNHEVLQIGQHRQLPQNANFIGMIDEARVYHGAQTQAEIAADMNAGTPDVDVDLLLRATAPGYEVQLINGPFSQAPSGGCGSVDPVADREGNAYIFADGGSLDPLFKIPPGGVAEVIAESGGPGVGTEECGLDFDHEGNLQIFIALPVSGGKEYFFFRMTGFPPLTLEPVSTPVIDPPGGTFTEQVLVSIATATAGADIRWTTDGSDPTGLSALYTGPIPLTESATLKARAFKSGRPDSAVASADFVINHTVLFNGAAASNRSSGWSVRGTELQAYNTPVWAEYLVDFGAGGSWTVGVTATNRNNPSAPNLPSGYAFNLTVAVDGVSKGNLQVPGSTTTYQTGALPITVPAGVHTVRLTWTNDVWSAGNFDSNLQIQSVSFAP